MEEQAADDGADGSDEERHPRGDVVSVWAAVCADPPLLLLHPDVLVGGEPGCGWKGSLQQDRRADVLMFEHLEC